MAESTKRRADWRPVKRGEQISVPCEGGYVGETAPEDGVMFQVPGQDSVYVPMSMVSRVQEVLRGMSKKGKDR